MKFFKQMSSDQKEWEIFVANASHELRTPLTIISGFAEVLQGASRLPPETIADVASKIVGTCERLNQVIESLLTLSGIEHAEKRLRLCPLLPLLENCAHLLCVAHPFAKVHITSKTSHPCAMIDPDLLDLAVMNLLENGVKYARQKEAILHLYVEQSIDEVVIVVQDEGVGIAKQDLPYIFDRFYTVDKARQRKTGGVGLGLAIVKSIIEKLSGRIEVASTPGQGTTFTLVLPA